MMVMMMVVIMMMMMVMVVVLMMMVMMMMMTFWEDLAHSQEGCGQSDDACLKLYLKDNKNFQ